MIKYIAKNFVFFVGVLFIFVFGLLYAYLKPEGILFNTLFLLVIVGWVIFMIKYFWELIDKEDK